jgi:hypothetical protein
MATASGKEEAKAVETAKVDPSNPTIAPTGNP